MYKIDGTTITLTKGDSFYCQLTLTKDGETYTPEAEDEIVFGFRNFIECLCFEWIHRICCVFVRL